MKRAVKVYLLGRVWKEVARILVAVLFRVDVYREGQSTMAGSDASKLAGPRKSRMVSM